jgi:formyl-CoA transferase
LPSAVVAAWSAKLGAGKRSMILDAKTPEGLGVRRTLVERADLVFGNILDHRMTRLRLDPVTRSRIDPNGILVQITALRGEQRGPRHEEKGYDPSQRATNGVTMRFGGPDAPDHYGIASTGDDLCDHHGAWSAVSALDRREVRGGADAPDVVAEIGDDARAVDDLQGRAVVLPTEWLCGRPG